MWLCKTQQVCMLGQNSQKLPNEFYNEAGSRMTFSADTLAESSLDDLYLQT